MERLKGAVAERSFLLAITGIMALAVVVNLIELLCSAGIPAVYTQVLVLSDLSAASYYGYLMLYIAVFLLDDAVVFVTAMLTLQAAGLAATYSRYSHLVGGVSSRRRGVPACFPAGMARVCVTREPGIPGQPCVAMMPTATSTPRPSARRLYRRGSRSAVGSRWLAPTVRAGSAPGGPMPGGPILLDRQKSCILRFDDQFIGQVSARVAANKSMEVSP